MRPLQGEAIRAAARPARGERPPGRRARRRCEVRRASKQPAARGILPIRTQLCLFLRLDRSTSGAWIEVRILYDSDRVAERVQNCGDPYSLAYVLNRR